MNNESHLKYHYNAWLTVQKCGFTFSGDKNWICERKLCLFFLSPTLAYFPLKTITKGQETGWSDCEDKSMECLHKSFAQLFQKLMTAKNLPKLCFFFVFFCSVDQMPILLNCQSKLFLSLLLHLRISLHIKVYFFFAWLILQTVYSAQAATVGWSGGSKKPRRKKKWKCLTGN